MKEGGWLVRVSSRARSYNQIRKTRMRTKLTIMDGALPRHTESTYRKRHVTEF